MTAAMSPAYEIGVVTFSGSDAAERLVESLRDRGAVGTSNEVGIVEHHASGRFSVHSYTPETTRGHHVGEGAVVGALAGALLLGPFGLLAGLFGGGLVGASMGGAHTHDLDLSDAFMKQLRDALPKDTSAVLIVGEPETVDQLINEIHSAEAVSTMELREPLTDAQVKAVQEALSADG